MPRTKTSRTKPVSDAQFAANRANAARSTGPRSPEGKARSAQNSRKHGFTGSTFAVVRFEDLEEVAHLRDDAVAAYRPVNSQELFAVERIAIAQQGLLRVARLEADRSFFTVAGALEGKRLNSPNDLVFRSNGDMYFTDRVAMSYTTMKL